MKKIALFAIALVTLVWFTAAQERNGLVVQDTQVAIDFLYENGLTMFSTENDFMASQSLRRDEAAAFFARFSRDVLGNTPDTSKTECNSFTDLSLGHSSLYGEVIASCQLWLFKWSQGRFMPTASFTNAEALTVLVRLIDWFKDESGLHWAENYLKTAQEMDLTNGLSANGKNNLDTNITRWDVAKLIEAGYTYKENQNITNNNTQEEENEEEGEIEQNNNESQSENNEETIGLNTPFIVWWIEYQILSVKSLDKIWSSTNEYIWYKYPDNGTRLMLEYSFKNINSEYWYAWEMRIQNGEDLYDESITAVVYAEEQMWYEEYGTSILEWAKKDTYVWFDVKADTLEWATLFIRARAGDRDDSVKIPLKNFLN